MAPSLPDSRFPEEGSRVGSWVVQERVGGGTHGVVFRVVHVDRPNGASYALKLARAPNDARFEREAWLLSRIQHPGVPRFEERGVWTNARGRSYPYLVMEWIEGVPLYQWAQEHGVTLGQVIGLLAQVARALEAVHEHGMHRDVKGDNVLVDRQGRVVLLDFGSCWYPDAPPLTEGTLPPGTEQYRSHQQVFFRFALSRGAGDYYVAPPQDDVYALGVTAYRLLASTYPPSAAAVAADETVQVAPPRGVAECCPELSALVLRMLSEVPDARGSSQQVAVELERMLRQANPLLDGVWIARSSSEPTEKTAPPEPAPEPVRPANRIVSLRVGCVATFFVLVMLLFALTNTGDRRGVAYTEAPQNTAQAPESPDAGTGLGVEAMASVSPPGAPSNSNSNSGRGVTREVPDDPLPGQKRPPCNKRGTVVINGGCWAPILEGFKPPCGPGIHEYKERCYVPLLVEAEQVPTSEDP